MQTFIENSFRRPGCAVEPFGSMPTLSPKYKGRTLRQKEGEKFYVKLRDEALEQMLKVLTNYKLSLSEKQPIDVANKFHLD